jgi:photosystem II stability/assembly factor-like uncharacterized protein
MLRLAEGQMLPYQVGSEIPIADLEEIEKAEPDVVWNGSEFLVVWHSSLRGALDLYGARVTEKGKVLDPEGIPLITEKGEQRSPRLAWGKDHALLVWVDTRAGETSRIYGARITRKGKVLDPKGFPIVAVPQKTGHPSVYWDGTQYWVVWERIYSFVHSEVYGARINQKGEILDPEGIRISRRAGQDYYASLSGDAEGRVFVVWGTRSAGQTDIWGARLNREGKVLDQEGILIASGPQDQFLPSLSWNGKEYLVAWIEGEVSQDPEEGAGPLIYGSRINPNGQIIEQSRPLSHLMVAHSLPFVFSQGEEFVVLWEEERKRTLIDAYGVRLLSDPKKSPQRVEISAYFGRQLAPRAAFSGKRSLVVWTDYRFGVPFYGNILGQLIEFSPAGKGKTQQATEEEKQGPSILHQIAIHPTDPRILYAATSHYGILKSADGGMTWSLTHQGLKSFTHTQVAIHPANPQIVYAGAWGGGVSRSRDGGKIWEERNQGLGNTAVDALALDPGNPEVLYVATPSGVYRSGDGGGHWESWSEGLPQGAEVGHTALLLSLTGETLFLGSTTGVYRQDPEAKRWERAGEHSPLSVTALAADAHGTIYAGTLGEGFWMSHDRGSNWENVVSPPHPLSRAWITAVVQDPGDPKRLYVATTGGVWKSETGGKDWSPMNYSLPVDKDIRSLGIAPTDSSRLYAGTFNGDILITHNSGKEWKETRQIPRLTKSEILALLPSLERPADNMSPPIPPAFVKCNSCHGWTDPYLDTRADKSPWRMPANERDWGPTLARMGPRAQLTPEEETQIRRFIEDYTKLRPLGNEPMGRSLTAERCGSCHALKVAGVCLAGDCSDPLKLKEVQERPWPLIVNWMREQGAELTETEEKEIVAYLQTLSPAKSYPLNWEKAATFKEGAWNIVALSVWKGRVFAGMEGNGKIYRSKNGEQWEEAAETGANRVYGLVPFQGALYAGTSDPRPEVWSSPDGVRWSKVAQLPEEELGIISLGVFGSHLYAGTEIGRVYRSSDGITWERTGVLQDPWNVNWVRFLVPFKGFLYAGTQNGGLFRSPDGRRWEAVGGELKNGKGEMYIRGAAVFKEALYVGTITGGEIWRTEEGTRWTRAFDASPAGSGGYVASITVFMDVLYAGVNGRIYRSHDGNQWEEVGYLTPYTIEAMAPFKGQLYAGTLLMGLTRLYRTAFDRKDTEEGLLVQQVIQNPSDPTILYAATFNQGVLRSQDRGETWAPVNEGIRNFLIPQIALHPEDPQILYAASWGGGIYKSEDGGNSWKEANRGLENTAVWGIAIHPETPRILFSGTATGIYRSEDGGNSWTSFNRGLGLGEKEEIEDGAFLFLPAHPAPLLIMGTSRGGYQTDLSTGEWSKIESLGAKIVSALAYDPHRKILFAGTGGEGLWQSRDRGASWTRVGGVGDLWVEEIFLSSGAIYLATRQGVYRSEDGGSRWAFLKEGVGELWVNALTSVSVTDSTILYAGSQGKGLWRSVNGGKAWQPIRTVLLPSPMEREALLTRHSPSFAEARGRSFPPASFAKCNGCHGWTDPVLNQHSPTPWRVFPSRREWGPTVRRMAHRAQLAPEEGQEIVQYLNAYYGREAS